MFLQSNGMRKITVIGVPLCLGSGKEGAQDGPEAFRATGVMSKLRTEGVEIIDKGDIHIDKVSEQMMYRSHKKMKYADVVVDTCNRLAVEVAEAIGRGELPIIVGGDHSIAVGSAAGAAIACDGDLGVVWIDAHGDINTSETSPSGNMHGMPLAALMGFGDPMWVDVGREGAKVRCENVVLAAIRSLDQGEMDLIKRESLNVIYMDEITRSGIDASQSRLSKVTKKVKNVHLSVDIDALDAQLVPGTGTPVENGLTVDQLYKLIRVVMDSGKVKSIDLVELNPRLDKDNNRTVKLCAELFEYIVDCERTNKK